MNEISILKLTKSNKPTNSIVITKGQKRRIQNKKRNTTDTTQRWAAWKKQLESGMTIAQVASEWGCSRKAIWYAKQRNFTKDTSTCPDMVRYSN
jgi:DNA-binding CsgD family transcriptional regulator